MDYSSMIMMHVIHACLHACQVRPVLGCMPALP